MAGSNENLKNENSSKQSPHKRFSDPYINDLSYFVKRIFVESIKLGKALTKVYFIILYFTYWIECRKCLLMKGF